MGYVLHDFQILLKSDHWWMEIAYNPMHNITPVAVLKSDHWWMEILFVLDFFLLFLKVKIRPLMDGNNIFNLGGAGNENNVKIRPLMDGNFYELMHAIDYNTC